jgi:sugar (pentulose or hexulose) kinase
MLRGIAVADVGATNSKLALFDPALTLVKERKIASRHVPSPPYAHLDPEPLMHFFAESLREFDAILPIDIVVPCAHGAALACLTADGSLALPVMDYLAEQPPAIAAAYHRIAPPFSEVYCSVLPGALTHALQLFWQETMFPEDFARIATIQPWIQYVGFRLSGARVCEISSMCCQTQLMDVRSHTPSSLARARGWDKLFAPMAKAWEVIGTLKPDFRGHGFRGEGRVLGGVHDSNGNFLRYLAAGLGEFTLLSTGTWIIGFDTSSDIERLAPERDTSTNTSVLGKNVATCRFFGGKELEILSGGAPAEAASLDCAARLMSRGTFALPSFTDSGGPIPGTGNRGRIVGPKPGSAEERATLAALYCALMTDQSLAAVGSKPQIIVDGPFAQNDVYLRLLAQLRLRQPVLASTLRDGTTVGAAALALMSENGKVPRIGLELTPFASPQAAGLEAYKTRWLSQFESP